MELECDICFIRLDVNNHRPKSLPCGHTICKECVENPALGKKCPSCRKVIMFKYPITKETKKKEILCFYERKFKKYTAFPIQIRILRICHFYIFLVEKYAIISFFIAFI